MTDTSTRMSPEWIANAVKNNPCVLLDTGNIRTCPVRLSFPHVFERSKPIPPNTEGKFGANLIFPVGADLSVLKAEAGKAASAKWADAGTPKGPKLRSPFKDQGEMLKYEGYAEGGEFISANSDKRPTCIDINGAVVTDEDKVYPGVWAICTVRPFVYDKGVNKGVAFGLQSVMIIADDKNLGGGSEDTSKAFAGVKIDAGDVDTSKLFA